MRHWLGAFLRMIRSPARYLLAILLASFLLNIWGINWGLPNRWHPDEITHRAEDMVSDLSPNPHHFSYGSLHYFQLIAFAVLPVKIPNKILNEVHYKQDKYLIFDYTTQEDIVIILSRLLSVLLGVGVVLLTYLLSEALFDYKAALFASSLLTISMGFVNISHFATTDIPSLFWFAMSCLMSTYVFVYGVGRWYLLSGLFSGFAAAVKYVGGISLLTLMSAHYLRNSRGSKNLLLGIIAAAGGFLVGNPVVIFSFFEFADGFIKENLYNSARSAQEPFAYLPYIHELINALGIPLFLLCICGVLYSLVLAVSKEYRSKILLIWSMILPYYMIMGSMHVSFLRYVITTVPFLLILTGKMMSDLIGLKSRPLKVTSIVVLAIVVGYSLVYAIAADLEITNDSRYLANEWLVKNASEGSRIEVTPYAPNIPSDKFVLITRPHNNAVDETASLIKNSSKYRFYQGVISNLESLTQKLGFGNKENLYVTWYEKAMARYRDEAVKFDLSVKGLESRAPDYLIVSEFYIERFYDDTSSIEGKFYDELFSGKTSYKKMAEFKYQFSPWIEPRVEFVNPKIYIFGKVKNE